MMFFRPGQNLLENITAIFPGTLSNFSAGTGGYASVCGHECEIIMATVCMCKERGGGAEEGMEWSQCFAFCCYILAED